MINEILTFNNPIYKFEVDSNIASSSQIQISFSNYTYKYSYVNTDVILHASEIHVDLTFNQPIVQFEKLIQKGSTVQISPEIIPDKVTEQDGGYLVEEIAIKYSPGPIFDYYYYVTIPEKVYISSCTKIIVKIPHFD